MVMDYVPGSTLEEYLKTHAPLAPAIKETLAMLNGGQVISSAPRLIRPAPPRHQRHPSTDKQATEAASKKQNNLLPLMLAVAGVLIVALIVVALLL